MPLQTTLQVSVADIYGRPVESLGTQLGRRQQFSDFRMVRGREQFLKLDGTVTTHDPDSTYRFGGPRLIVAERSIRRYTFTETGREAIPTAGQWYMNDDGVIAQAQPGATYAQPYIIMERTEAEVR